MGNGNLHRHSDLPVLAAGKLNGKFKTGYHFDYKQDTPMANLLVTILDSTGVPIEKVGDSTGQLLLDYSRVRLPSELHAAITSAVKLFGSRNRSVPFSDPVSTLTPSF